MVEQNPQGKGTNRELNQDVVVVLYMLSNTVVCSVFNFVVVSETNNNIVVP